MAAVPEVMAIPDMATMPVVPPHVSSVAPKVASMAAEVTSMPPVAASMSASGISCPGPCNGDKPEGGGSQGPHH